MKKMLLKKVITVSLSLVMAIALLTGCSAGGNNKSEGNTTKDTTQDNTTNSSGGTITVDFWTAPEQYNLDFWSKYADKFNNSNVQLDGKKIMVKVQMMPAQPSSEAGIQNAIATGTVPAISENINRGFANTLAESQAVYDISKEDWFGSIVQERKIESVMEGWAINGAQYVIPLYVNPITYCYNSKALKSLGINEVPQTVSDFNTLLETYKDKKDTLNSQGITHFMYRSELLNSANWWERWFDVESQYDAFSQGTPLVEGNKLTADKGALSKVFELYANIGSSLLTGTIEGVWQQAEVPVVMGIGLPWEISANTAAGKVYGIDGDYVFGPTFVENEGDIHYNYADSKGVVLYKNSAISEEEHNGAIEFLKYVFTGEGKDTVDIDWLKATSMLPVRGDLASNEALASYFGENPALKDVSSFVSGGVPVMANGKVADIMTALGEKAVIPFVNEVVASSGINENPDVTKYVDAALNAMQEAGSLE